MAGEGVARPELQEAHASRGGGEASDGKGLSSRRRSRCDGVDLQRQGMRPATGGRSWPEPARKTARPGGRRPTRHIFLPLLRNGTDQSSIASASSAGTHDLASYEAERRGGSGQPTAVDEGSSDACPASGCLPSSSSPAASTSRSRPPPWNRVRAAEVDDEYPEKFLKDA